MSAGNHPGPVFFHCPSCAGTLSVPAEMAGIAGPCPFCRQNIRSPEGAYRPMAAAGAGAGGPGGLHRAIPSSVILQDPAAPPERQPLGARKRMQAIARTWGIDESWKERHRERARRFYKKQKLEKLFSRFLSIKSGIAVAAVFTAFMGLLIFRHYDKKNDAPVRHLERMDSFVNGGVLVGQPAPAPAANWKPANGFIVEKQSTAP